MAITGQRTHAPEETLALRKLAQFNVFVKNCMGPYPSTQPVTQPVSIPSEIIKGFQKWMLIKKEIK